MLVLLAIQVKSEVFQKTELQFQAPQPYVVQTSKPIPGRPDSSSISLPYAVNGTALIVERLVSYDGAFLENNSGCEVKNVAALLMTNSGDMGISQVRVLLDQGGRQLSFQATQIPPGASLLVLEESAKRYTQSMITGCYGVIEWESDGWCVEELLSFEEADMGSLWVTRESRSYLPAFKSSKTERQHL